MDMYQAISKLGGVALPHCDQQVLHAPGECKYCDEYPTWQALRVVWGIAFTGHVPDINDRDNRVVPCPSDMRRGLGGAHGWPGNRPVPEGK